jgi:RNA polymerase sigma factor (sigma-70 family)
MSSKSRIRRDDIAVLYMALAPNLERIVRLDVRASDQVIEDACQSAWARLVFHADRLRGTGTLSWLAKTATREAVKLSRRDHRELSLELALEIEGDALGPPGAAPDELIQDREQLASIRLLPERQQRLLWLQGLGLSYTEMAAHTHCSERTIERQLLRAKRRLRGMAATSSGAAAPAPASAAARRATTLPAPVSAGAARPD